MRYLPVDFKIAFREPALVDNNPAFVLRGLLGSNLKNMCCMDKESLCTDCLYNKHCIYALIFESIIEKDEAPIPGSDRTSHPYAITYSDNVPIWSVISEYNFTISLFGKYTEYLPYVYGAILRAGKKGMFRNRIPFDIIEASINGNSILLDDDNIDLNHQPLILNDCAFSDSKNPQRFRIELYTPLRFKINGSYADDFNALEFMKCLHRRYITMMNFYGEFESKDFCHYLETSLNIENKNLKWKSESRYSGRQKQSMKFTGVVGSFELTGKFTAYELMLLAFNEITNAGKNTNFGLGQIQIYEIS